MSTPRLCPGISRGSGWWVVQDLSYLRFVLGQRQRCSDRRNDLTGRCLFCCYRRNRRDCGLCRRVQDGGCGLTSLHNPVEKTQSLDREHKQYENAYRDTHSDASYKQSVFEKFRVGRGPTPW